MVERGIGQLKRRFFVLQSDIRVEPPSKVCQVIEVCAMLHNICKNRNINIPEGVENLAAEDAGNVRPPPAWEPERRREGIMYRNEFAMHHFK